MKVPFFKLSFTKAEKKEVLDALESGWVTTGPKVREFEQKMTALTGARHAVAVSSATAGLHLAIETLNPRVDAEIVTTPFTMAATIEAIIYSGARPVLADIDPVTLNINPDVVEKKLTKKTKAVLSVDIAGCPCQYHRLKRITKSKKLFLLADAAHSLGARFKRRPVGSLADATVFSFYSTKNLTTGEGGMIVSNSGKLIDAARHLALHGMTSSGWKRYQGGSWCYDITDLGYKYNMTDIAAGLGLGQLTHFKKSQNKRVRLAKRYMQNLKNLEEFVESPRCDQLSEHAWHLFIIKMNLDRWEINRDQLIEELEKRGVGSGVHFIPVYRFSYFRKTIPHKLKDFPESEKAFKRIISLPLYPDLTFEEVDYVCDVLDDLSQKFSR